MNRTIFAGLVVASAALFACHPGGAPDAGVDAGAAAHDAGPPPLPELTIALQFAPSAADAGMIGTDAGVAASADAGAAQTGAADGGVAMQTIELRPGERPAIAPVQNLTILVNRGLKNARLRILDEVDRVVPSDENLHVRATEIRDQVHFQEPLIAGHKYVLVLDAENGPDILDERGQPILGQRLEFATSGQRPPPVKKAPPAKKRRRRRR